MRNGEEGNESDRGEQVILQRADYCPSRPPKWIGQVVFYCCCRFYDLSNGSLFAQYVDHKLKSRFRGRKACKK